MGILHTADQKVINKYLNIAKIFQETQITRPTPKNLSRISHTWKKNMKKSTAAQVTEICKSLPQEYMPIYTILDLLKGTDTALVLTAQRKDNTRANIRSKHYLSEEEIVKSVFAILQGGYSGVISYIQENVQIDGIVMPPQKNLILRISKIGLYLHTIQLTIHNLKGIIGQSVADILETERTKYIKNITDYQVPGISLLSLYAHACGPLSERIEAAAVICKIMEAYEEEEIFYALEQTQIHGNPIVKQVGLQMYNAGKQAFYELVKEWVNYGILNDPYHEFFVYEAEEDVEESEWWENRYCVDTSKIPPFIVSDTAIAQITACGRAWNFIKLYKQLMVEEASLRNIVVYRKLTELPTRNIEDSKNFDIIENLHESMRTVMQIINNFIWMPGHIHALNDFLLFFRGDFSLSLYEAFNSDFSSAPYHLLQVATSSITQGIGYTNPTTGENLVENLEIEMRATRYMDPTPEGIVLWYRLPKPLRFLIDDQIIQDYQIISQLCWRLKCTEIRLSNNWKRFQKIRPIFGRDDIRNLRLQNCLRYKFITIVRAISGFICCDVLLVDSEEFIKKIESINNYDDMLRLLRTFVSTIKRKTLLTSNFEEIQNSINQFFTIAESFCEIEEQIAEVFEDVNEEILKIEGEDVSTLAEFMKTMKRSYEDAAYQLNKVSDEYEECLQNLYDDASDSKVDEFVFLESMLRYCKSKK